MGNRRSERSRCTRAGGRALRSQAAGARLGCAPEALDLRERPLIFDGIEMRADLGTLWRQRRCGMVTQMRVHHVVDHVAWPDCSVGELRECDGVFELIGEVWSRSHGFDHARTLRLCQQSEVTDAIGE